MLLALALLAGSLLAQQSIPAGGATCTGGVVGAADICLAEHEFAQAEAMRAAADRRPSNSPFAT